MKDWRSSKGNPNRRARRTELVAITLFLFLASSAAASSTTQLLLGRDQRPPAGDYRGVVELTIDPGIENARVSVTLDGQVLADALRAPYKMVIDFGPSPVEHRIAIKAWNPADKRRVQWHDTVNNGLQSLTVRIHPVDVATRAFEAVVTAPREDPIEHVELWNNGSRVAVATEPPYRFTVPLENFRSGMLQMTARTKSGEEAADFWSPAGQVHVESVDVRTVPILVSVVDGSGQAHNDVDRSLFRILDNDAEGKILEFGKAFDQPISIALLVDSSASMTYELQHATRAAQSFVEKIIKPGDRCAVFAVQDVPRRVQELTSDRALVTKSLKTMTPGGRTSLYDAITSAVRELKDEKTRRAIVILTDGGDTSSMSTFDELDKTATEAGIPIYVIAYESGEPAEKHDLDRMNYLAGQTGGFVVTASKQSLPARYAAIERDLRSQYAIVYQVTDFARHKEWRKVRVTLKSASLNARTIHGYFAP
ncbi:MAG: VWA domain-containing protein [Acidobacteriota bacterium]